jgi:O-antigen/teichoic acid export membrane protein
VLSRGLGGLGVFALTYWLTLNLPLATALEALAWCATNVFDQRLLARLDARTRWADLAAVRPARLGRLAWWILPLGISLWLARAGQSAPPLVLERYTDLAAVGVFGAMSYLNTSLSMMSGVLGSASAARLRRLYRNGQQREFGRLALKLTLLSATLGATGVLIAWLARPSGGG